MTQHAADRIRGTLYGQAIGDALGLPVEFRSSSFINRTYPDKTWPSAYQEVRRQDGTSWQPGEWTDDTEQALCLLDAYLRKVTQEGQRVLDPVFVAEEFLQWAETNGRGMGNHTWLVISDPLFALEPHLVSESVWEDGGRKAAPNGAVMRTSYVGVFQPWDLDWTEKAAVDGAKVTHFDPRCVASSVAVSVAVAVLCMDGVRGLDQALHEASTRAAKYHAEAPKWILDQTLESLQLDEGMVGYRKGTPRPPIGYTYKCLGAGFWALREFKRREDEQHDDLYEDRFHDILRQVIRAGGDADTNGAVAGALLGAAVGYNHLPSPLVAGLYDPSDLETRMTHLWETLERGLTDVLTQEAQEMGFYR